MRLKNPGGLDDAVTTVQQVKGKLMSATSGASAARKDVFLTWCDHWTTPQLGNHLPASENTFAEVAEFYYRLAVTPEMSERQLNGLLNREFAAWDARLDRVLAELRQLKQFLLRPGRLVVLDTSTRGEQSRRCGSGLPEPQYPTGEQKD
jgi:hypothetical protein